MIDLDNYDCVKCGACCVSDYDAPDYVHLHVEDLARLEPEDRAKYAFESTSYGESRSLRTSRDSQGNCRCRALSGKIGDQVACAIYDRRPSACRRFEAGTTACDLARRSTFGVSER